MGSYLPRPLLRAVDVAHQIAVIHVNLRENAIFDAQNADAVSQHLAALGQRRLGPGHVVQSCPPLVQNGFGGLEAGILTGNRAAVHRALHDPGREGETPVVLERMCWRRRL